MNARTQPALVVVSLLAFALLAGCTVLFGAAVANAQQPDQAPTSSGADQHADRAREAYRTGNYEAALQRFEMAYRDEQRPEFLYNMGRCLEKLERYAEAIDRLQSYLDNYRQQNAGKHAPNRADVLTLIRALRLLEVRQRPQVVIASNPPHAQVTMVRTGQPLGLTPLTTNLEPGFYKIRLTLDDHEPLEADIHVTQGKMVRAVFSLSPATERAALSVWCNVRGASVRLDGKTVATTPYEGRLYATPGRHRLAVQRAGYQTVEEIIELPRDQELHIDYVLVAETSLRSWRSYVGLPLLVVGIAAVGGGVAASIKADSYYADSANYNTFTGLQTGGYVGGGIALGTGIGLLLWDTLRDTVSEHARTPGPPRPSGRRLRPLAQAGPGR